MRMDEQPRSSNVEDRRGRSVRGGVPIGIGTVVILLIVWLLGGDPRALLAALEDAAPPEAPRQVQDDGTADFVSKVLADTERTWREILGARGVAYVEPTLVLFTDRVSSACGYQSAAVGPFYCPADQKIYIDLGFYDALARRHGAPGDFAQAYVLAHEVGHHVQNLLGTSGKVHDAQTANPGQANALSVGLELQADCYAGIWGHYAAKRGLLEPGDAEEGLRAAAAIGDDTLQRQAQGYVVPESFTHGSSEQRLSWFARGMDQGELSACDTFGR